MTYNKFLQKLDMDTSVSDLRKYITGELRLPESLKKHHEDIRKQLPKILKRNIKSTEEFGKDLVNSKFFKLAFYKVAQKRGRDVVNIDSIGKVFIETVQTMTEILGLVNYSEANGNKNTKIMLKEYCERD
jgi:hypothetical protein